MTRAGPQHDPTAFLRVMTFEDEEAERVHSS